MQEVSKTLYCWLRHAPEAGRLTLDASGWASMDEVRNALSARDLYPSLIERTVAENDKQRFEISTDGSRIRALPAILAEGLKPMQRHHVHLSTDAGTASRVGARRGTALVLRIAAGAMARSGVVFRLSGNGVWLVDAVPPAFIERD